MELVTARLLLRDFTAADAAAFADYRRDPRAREFEDPDESPPASALVERFVLWAGERPRRDWQLAVALRDAPDRVVGTCGLRTRGLPPGVAEFGVELAPACWGRGLAHEAARALLAWGFGERGLAEVRADTVGGNARVARLLERLGFASVETRPGTSWMAARGWERVEWRLARADYGATSPAPTPRAR